MAIANVKAPFGGTVTGRTKYCNCKNPEICEGSGLTHSTCVGGAAGSQIDITPNNSDAIYLRVNYPTVRSIKTWVEIRCCDSRCSNDIRRTITVELYALPDAGCYIGSVKYAHIANPQVSNGGIYNLTSSSKWLGTAASGFCYCSSGPHAHMERSGGSGPSACCCTTVTTSNIIYSWTVPDPCPTAIKPA